MKIGFAIGLGSHSRVRKIYSSLKNEGLKPNFILFCFPKLKKFSFSCCFKSIISIKELLTRLKILLPMIIVRKVYQYRYRIPDFDSIVYYVNGINSDEAFETLSQEMPDAVIVVGCGIVGKKLCDDFHNKLLNAHAGKLPEYRGKNNVEWAYLDNAELVGTIHFIATGPDTGDIIYEKKLKKEKHPESIPEIRERAFDQVFDLFPMALKAMQEDNFKPIKQTKERTTRYVMHSFLKRMLEKKLAMNNRQ